MADPLKTGTNALLAFQRAIATTSHNIANAGTEGYSRQRVEMESVSPVKQHYGYIGYGVNVANIVRMEDQFAEAQLLQTGTELARINTIHNYAGQLDNLLANDSLSLTPSMNSFFGALQDANNHPTDPTVRDNVLGSARHMVSTIKSLYDGMDSTRVQLQRELALTTDEINAITAQIAELDGTIAATAGDGHNRSPNDLLDQRNRLLGQLASQIDITTVEASNGRINIFTGNGQALLSGGTARSLVIMDDPTRASGLTVGLNDGSVEVAISNQISGGKLGGLVDFDRTTLTRAFNELGRITLTLASSTNSQHRMGLDATGLEGVDFFKLGEIHVAEHSTNTGTGIVSATLDDASALSNSNYEVSYDGLDYTLTRLSDNTSVTGGTTLSMDGMTVNIAGTMSTTDKFAVSPTRYAAREIDVALSSGGQVALSSALRTTKSPTSLGSGEIELEQIADPANASFNTPINFVFNEPPTTYNIVDRDTNTVLSSNVTYVEGDTITMNGWSAKISGNPLAGDTLGIEPNQGGLANNGNGLLLSGIESQAIVENMHTLSDTYGSMAADIGIRTRQADLTGQSTQSMHNSVLERRETTAGVNLDEEAINLTRYQQAYQAAAQIINASDQMFQSLIGAIR
ncbi:MAG: flagellar hook-associated protein FlgK [Granulosicoccus sp.]|nr:flagellar hook-associated protein FlgK [Granulosicoccus sp.]